MRWLAAAVVLASTPAFADPLPVKLADGATWTMTVEKVRERQRGTTPPRIEKTKTTSTLTWTKDGDAGRLTALVTSVDREGAGAREIAGALDLERPVQADADAALTPERIRNWNEVRESLSQMIDRTITDAKAAEMSKAFFANLTAEQAAQLVLRDQALASVSQGTDLEIGKPVDYDDVLPNPLGGPPIETKGRFELLSHDVAKGQAVVAWRQAFDQASATRSIAAALTGMIAQAAPDQVDKLKAAFVNAKVDRVDTCRHEIDIPTGLAVRAICDSITEIVVQGEAGRNVDRWTITQTLPKASP